MIAIDFGTSAIRAAIVTGSEASPVVFDGEAELPAAVYFPDGADRPRVGMAAEKMGVVDSERVVRGAKRLLGQSFADVHARSLSRRMTHPLAATASGEAALDVGGTTHGACELSAWLFRAVATACPGEREVVLAVPSSFGCAQRQAVRDAAAAAGLEVKRMVSEPVAAAIGRLTEDGVFLVCDIGAGVADVAVVSRRERVFEVLATSADIGWGGDDLDVAIARQLADAASEEAGVQLRGDRRALGRILGEARRLKHEMAEAGQTQLFIPVVFQRADGAEIDIDREVTSEQLNDWLEPVARRLELPCHDAVAAAGMSQEDLDGILVCGGAIHSSAVKVALCRALGQEISACEEPESAVLDGLVELARARGKEAESLWVMDSVPESIGISSSEVFAPVLSSGTRFPVRTHKLIALGDKSDDGVHIALFSGESSDAAHNRLIASYLCEGAAELAGRDALVELSLTLDENGLLFLSGAEMSSGQPLQIKRVGGPGLTREQLRALSIELASDGQKS